LNTITWKYLLRTKFWRNELLITLILFFGIAQLFSQFLVLAEQREGLSFTDPVLQYIGPIDVSWITFAFTYSAVLFIVLFNYKKPGILVNVIQGYGIVLLFRMVSIGIFPLYAPDTIIHLNDPVLNNLFYPTDTTLRDLFFSGHVATMILFALNVKVNWQKLMFAGFAAVVGILVVVQHVHYSIDVLAAPSFCYLAYKLQQYLRESYSRKIEV
jgi:hypothetical protein